MSTDRNEGKPSWRIRRRIIIATLIFCAAEVAYLTGWGDDTRLAEAIATGCLLLAGSVIGSYVFGAAWQDIKLDRRDEAGPPMGRYEP